MDHVRKKILKYILVANTISAQILVPDAIPEAATVEETVESFPKFKGTFSLNLYFYGWYHT